MKRKKLFFVIIFCFFLVSSSPVNLEAKQNKIVQPIAKYSYKTMLEDAIQLKTKYKGQIELVELGYTYFGRKIIALKVGRGDKNIIMIGAHHGREWITTNLLMNMVEYYADAYKAEHQLANFSPSILDQVSIWFIPMLNPDGVMIQQQGLKAVPFWTRQKLLHLNESSSNFLRWKANGRGVDLNRQYPAGWKQLKGPSKPTYQFYKGTKPLQEQEVILLSRFVQQQKPLIGVAYHTAGRVIFWNYKNGGNLNRDHNLAMKVSGLTHYPLSNVPENAKGGGFTDWFITTYKRPAMTIELSYNVGERNPPLSVFGEEWNRNKLVGIMLADQAIKLGLE